MATGAVMPVKMKANTVPVVMAASCTRRRGCPARLSSNIGRNAATAARQAIGPAVVTTASGSLRILAWASFLA
jgi:hypothetical protein